MFPVNVFPRDVTEIRILDPGRTREDGSACRNVGAFLLLLSRHSVIIIPTYLSTD
jgi:hypothetical protein